jgi:hypothetical protein
LPFGRPDIRQQCTADLGKRPKRPRVRETLHRHIGRQLAGEAELVREARRAAHDEVEGCPDHLEQRVRSGNALYPR